MEMESKKACSGLRLQVAKHEPRRVDQLPLLGRLIWRSSASRPCSWLLGGLKSRPLMS